MESASFDGGDDDEHIGISLVEISKISTVQDAFFFDTEPFDRI